MKPHVFESFLVCAQCWRPASDYIHTVPEPKVEESAEPARGVQEAVERFQRALQTEQQHHGPYHNCVPIGHATTVFRADVAKLQRENEELRTKAERCHAGYEARGRTIDAYEEDITKCVRDKARAEAQLAQAQKERDAALCEKDAMQAERDRAQLALSLSASLSQRKPRRKEPRS